MRRLFASLLVVAAVARGAEPAAPAAAPLCRCEEACERQVFIPSAQNRHGEVRVLKREGVDCVQTLLYSPALARGLKAIRGKEFGAWPEGSPGYADSTNYLAALRRAETTVREEFERRADSAELRQKLLIEFLCAERAAWIALYRVELAEQDGAMKITRAEPLEVKPVSRAYARRAMDLMIENAFRPAPAANH